MILRLSRCRIVWFCLLLLAALAAGCVPAGDQSAVPTGVGGTPVTATPPPPAWREAALPVTLENAPQLAYLGRLDPPAGTASTLFAHAVSPDGTRLAGLNNTYLVAWDLINGALLFANAASGANRVYYAPDKTALYTLTPDGQGRIYDAETGVQQGDFIAQQSAITAAAYSPEDGWLAVGAEGGEVKVWDPLERLSLVTFQGTDVQVNTLVFSADGTRLAAADLQGTVRLWQWRERSLLGTFNVGAVNILALALSPAGDQIAIATQVEVQLWSIPDGTLQHTLEISLGGVNQVLSYAPDGSTLVGGGEAPNLFVWNPLDGTLIGQLPGVGGDRMSAAFSPDGDMLLTSVLFGPVNLWNMRGFVADAQTASPAALDFGGTQILAVNWSSDGRALLLVDWTGPVHVWGVAAPPAGQ